MKNGIDLKKFLLSILIIGTLGLLIIGALGGFEGDYGMVLFPLLIIGLPWVVLLSSLIPNFGNYGDLIIMIISFYINIFIIWIIVKKLSRKPNSSSNILH